MFNELKMKVALGQPLTEMERQTLLSEPELAKFAERTLLVDRLADLVRSEPIDQAVLDRALTWTRQQKDEAPRGARWVKVGFVMAVLTILGAPLAALIYGSWGLSGQGRLIALGGPQKPAERTAVLVFAHLKSVDRLEPISCTIILPGLPGQKGQATGGRQSQIESTPRIPVKFWEATPDHQEALKEWSEVMSSPMDVTDPPLMQAERWMGQRPSVPIKLAPAILEINRKSVRLMGWRLASSQPNRWVIAYGEKVTGRMPRLEFWEKQGSQDRLRFRQDSFPHHEEILGHKIIFGPRPKQKP